MPTPTLANSTLLPWHHPVQNAHAADPELARLHGPKRGSVPVPRRSACACGGICPRCSETSSPLGSRDFSEVRVHPDAAKVTAPLHARAATIGQDIYFHPGQYRPGTPEGDTLLAHELAHTLQTRAFAGDAEPVVTSPDDVLEKNADALARGATAHPLAAPPGAVLRSPFDSENAADRARRETLTQSIDNAVQSLLRLLQTGGLLRGTEVAVERGGVRGIIYGAHTAGTPREEFQSYAQRDARVRRIIRTLLAMATRYRSAPLPADFSPPVLSEDGQNYDSTVQHPASSGISQSTYQGASREWADLQAAYERYRIVQGRTGDAYESDWYYLDPSLVIDPGAARGAPRIGGGIQTGVYMVVPDVDREPLRYWRLSGNSPAPRGSTIIELWHDSFGYFYMHRGQRIDVPSPWR